MHITSTRLVLCALAPVSAALVMAGPAHSAFDHLQCFKIKADTAAATYTANINPADLTFDALPPSCEIKVPAKLLCVDAEKTGVLPSPPGAPDGVPTQPYLCYKAKCTKVQPSATLTDQFGVHSIEVKSTKMVCAPVPAPTTTTTTLACTDADNDTYTDCEGDCNDADNSVNPGASEVCNDIDDNCNAMVDEGNPGGGMGCSTGLPGQCSTGTIVCSGGALSCQQNLMATSEVCDSKDNDCNGIVDDGNPGGGVPCATGMPGQCAAGTTLCSGGVLSCQQNMMASSEVCDSVDNDCDGVVDDGVCLANGAPCTVSSQCNSSQCVDDVCCNDACNTTCVACSAAKKGSGIDGTCGFIPLNNDPDSECAGTMVCDGAGTCIP